MNGTLGEYLIIALALRNARLGADASELNKKAQRLLPQVGVGPYPLHIVAPEPEMVLRDRKNAMGLKCHDALAHRPS